MLINVIITCNLWQIEEPVGVLEETTNSVSDYTDWSTFDGELYTFHILKACLFTCGFLCKSDNILLIVDGFLNI